MSAGSDAKPNINVTPLIDVLLVLLIIFMLISPLKPARFETKIPSESNPNDRVNPHPLAIVVSVSPDLTLKINNEKVLTPLAEPTNLIATLSEKFTERALNGVLRPGTNEVEKTVFIKAPRTLPYGEVAKVVDAVKQAGASPIGLQVDNLD
jgi:biopolymer transport protein ExbD